MEQLQHSESAGINSNIQESIKSAAIIFNGEKYTGINHAMAIRELEKVQPDWRKTNNEPVQEGFVTSIDRFVSRQEAAEIAERAEQLNHLDTYQKIDSASGLDSSHLRH